MALQSALPNQAIDLLFGKAFADVIDIPSLSFNEDRHNFKKVGLREIFTGLLFWLARRNAKATSAIVRGFASYRREYSHLGEVAFCRHFRYGFYGLCVVQRFSWLGFEFNIIVILRFNPAF